MTAIVELEQAIDHLEKIGMQLHNQSAGFFPNKEFLDLDQEAATILEVISAIKSSIAIAEFNNGISDLRFQLQYLEARYLQLMTFFMQEDGDQLIDSVTSLHNDIIHTKRLLHIRRHQDVNIVLDEKSNQLLERYQLI